MKIKDKAGEGAGFCKKSLSAQYIKKMRFTAEPPKTVNRPRTVRLTVKRLVSHLEQLPGQRR
jgi:hypothetical protein